MYWVNQIWQKIQGIVQRTLQRKSPQNFKTSRHASVWQFWVWVPFSQIYANHTNHRRKYDLHPSLKQGSKNILHHVLGYIFPFSRSRCQTISCSISLSNQSSRQFSNKYLSHQLLSLLFSLFNFLASFLSQFLSKLLSRLLSKFPLKQHPQYPLWQTIYWKNQPSSILLLSLMVALGIWGCQWLPGGTAQVLPQHPHIQVFMNQNPANRYTDPYRNITKEGDNLEQILIDTIGQAKQTIDLAVQELRLPNLAQALVDAQNRGVRVRLILENQYSRPWSEYSFDEVKAFNSYRREAYNEFLKFADINHDGTIVASEWEARDALLKIRKANIPWLDDTADGSKGSGLMHHKFMVIDNQVVVVTSANFTLSDIHGDFSNPDSRGNANNLLKISHGELAGLFGQEFQLMWGDGPGGKPDSLFGIHKPSRKIAYFVLDNAQIRLKFSPDRKNGPWEQSSNGLIGTVLSGAQQSVNMALFVYSDPRISTILHHRYQNNVNIRVLLDPQFAYRKYSSALGMWGFVSSADCQLGDGIPWSKPLTTVGVPSLNSGDKLHHKFAVLDQNMVITGSHNWTNAANYSNDETLLVVQSPVVAAHFQREFERLYKNATFGPNTKLSQSAPRSCDASTASPKPSNGSTPSANKSDEDE